MTYDERINFFKENREHLTQEQMAKSLQKSLATIRNYEREHGPCAPETVRETDPQQLIAQEKRLKRLSESDRDLKQKVRALVEENERLERELGAAIDLSNHDQELFIKPPKKGKKTESTMVVLASDWHFGKTTDPLVVPGSTFNIAIANARAVRFFQRVVKMLEFEQREVEVKHVVLALLGDFIEGSLHPDSMETAGAQPSMQTILAFDAVAAGIQYILDHTEVSLSIPCLVGNHSRTTEKVRNSTEVGYSYETLMYHFLADRFRDNPRVKFHVSQSVHFYMTVYDKTLRFMHGHHGLKGGGGVGGLAIPLIRAIGKWDRTRRADITILGHFHHVIDVAIGIVNGSLCGYDAYSMSEGFPFEKPKQIYFMINSKYGRNGYREIHLEE